MRLGHDHHACPCQAAGRWCHGSYAATLDGNRIQQWWGPRPQMGVAVACGPSSSTSTPTPRHPLQESAPARHLHRRGHRRVLPPGVRLLLVRCLCEVRSQSSPMGPKWATAAPVSKAQ
ncbi:bifunctional DNA primase/polymerase [Streptomyces sp. NPDC006971]|uniref:bifunctional DNA primase/polymerase n=1 Tax=Streptomyces sp. NPDC006971 TaxID=3154784 RepID=UPI0033FF2F56